LQHAAKITLSSSGANTAGIDGITKVHLQDSLDCYLNEISLSLLTGDNNPMPGRRVYIRKTNGKQRPLVIPSLKKRIVQRAMLMAMESIWENGFHPHSYEFIPERSVHHAIRTVQLQLNGADIQKDAG
jgi:RNA-directed DNA polymerase